MRMNLTLYVVVIAFIFALFYLCSRESTEEDELPSTGDDCGDLRPPSCTIDVPDAHQHPPQQQQQQPPQHSSLIRAPPDSGNHQVVPQNVCPPSYEQVICNEDFYSLNKGAAKNQQMAQ